MANTNEAADHLLIGDDDSKLISELSDHNSQGPSVESSNYEERIAARRERIKRRFEQPENFSTELKKSEDNENKFDLELKATVTESQNRIQSLLWETSNTVSNVKISSLKVESSRRQNLITQEKQREIKLKEDSEMSERLFNDIATKWNEILQEKNVQSLHARLEEQIGKCNEVIRRKNSLIIALQVEAKKRDDQYAEDIENQLEDIMTLFKRMNSQCAIMNSAMQEELINLQRHTECERAVLLRKTQDEWNTLVSKLENNEKQFLKDRREMIELGTEDIIRINVQNAEKFRQLREKLDKDVDVLQQQLEKMKAVYLLNAEKLDYNYQVLKKRDEENTVSKSDQKRQINKLQDSLTTLQSKFHVVKNQAEKTKTSLAADIKKITNQIGEVRYQIKMLLAHEKKKYNQLLNLSEDMCLNMVKLIIEAECKIYQRILGTKYVRPNIEECLMDIVGRSTVKSIQEGTEVAGDQSRNPSNSELALGHDDVETVVSHVYDSSRDPKVIRECLISLANQAGFLIEPKLDYMLDGLNKNAKLMYKLHIILKSLQIDSLDDVMKFVKHLECYTSPSYKKDGIRSGARNKMSPRNQTFEFQPLEASVLPDEGRRLTISSDSEVFPEEEMSINLSMQTASACTMVALDIDTQNVLKSLRFMVEEQLEKKSIAEVEELVTVMPSGSGDSLLCAPQKGLGEAYWKAYTFIVSPGKERLWDSLHVGLNKYQALLTKRQQLIADVLAIQQQNSELTELLRSR